MTKRYLIEVEISHVEVDSEYYTFKYKVRVDGKLKEKGEINDDYENGLTPMGQKQLLEEGEALNLAVYRAFE